MDRQTEIRLIKQALELKARGETQYHESTQTHATDRYISAAWFERENDMLFQRQPIALAAGAEIPNPGDYLSVEWVKGVPLLLVRGEDQQVRVFANACRHRNARLVATGESGCRKRFVCPYHAWTYDTRGNLAGAPDFERGFADLDQQKLGLVEFHCRELGGMVFFHPDRNAEVPEDLLAPEMASGFDYLKLAAQRVYKRRSYVIKANWKILLEGGIEAYHFNVAHKNTLAPFFLGNISTWESWGDLQMRMILPKKPILEAAELPEQAWDMRKMANIIFTLTPAVLLLAQPDNISLIRMVPLSAGETRIEEVLLVDPPQSGAEQWSEQELTIHETNHNLVHKILMEDWVLGETIQANMASGVVDEIHFGRFESALTWFHEQYARLMALDDGVIARLA
ncbi:MULTISPECIES: aromatic ring-hydroxylating dioxygenase subunit alpha [unclassified Cobetia]|uniref:aromatic ring-hydroxylating oxygenase subunit alpha n=1 Tax=unclassified Cobetia TaxID=2609414 RepID=UPI002097668A|nr:MULTISPECIES: SRPBCC family protein [unclassified Cobetia]MCO7231716.1 Rieske 2Fe-2S domain-containing protein [Cobetia sp. Dlab-2-AX]MCO7234968.1 Rieske 2Fe-2S domain-containing protein [Cobetia sp. Dlab-2-U]